MNNIKKYIVMFIAVIIYTYAQPTLANNYQSSYKYSAPYTPPPSYYKPYIAENGSYRGQFSEKTYRPKNNYVRNYQRNDSRYVRGHYRSRKR
jgi:hypothetical protein